LNVDGHPIPKLVVNGQEPGEECERTETGSEQGSVYDETNFGDHSIEDLTSRGELDMHLKYDHRRNCLVVKVIGVKHLRSRDSEHKTNPFVRLYLLPDRSKKTRKVTKIIRGSFDGEFHETFEFAVGLDLLADRQLECAVKSDRGLRNRLIGSSTAELGELDLNEGCTLHCDLKKI
jgi:hypothetical protein